MVLLLIVAAAIALASGDLIDAIAIAAALVINASIGFVTEWRARRAMHALLQLEVPRATVLRDGTDVAKEAASVVLQDDRFETIAAAIEEGRVIFANIQKFVFYLFSCNLAEVLVLLVAGIAGLPIPLLPLQILWLNLVTDTFPAFALALEPAELDVMRRPPPIRRQRCSRAP